MTYEKVESRQQREKADFLAAMADGATRNEACKVIGRSAATVAKWRRDDPRFKEQMDMWSGKRRTQVHQTRTVLQSDREFPDPGGLAQFRWDVFGFPTAYPDQEYMTEALEDFTNQVVLILAPPGAGKDTMAGQYLLWRVAPDRTGLRAAWIMESEPFSRRRLAERLSPYLTDQRVYDHTPTGPGTQKPTRNLIDDYGPFRWNKDYRWDTGEPVARTTWNKNEMYFMRVAAPESDPNLWATGITGTLYGARVDEMIMSDVFTRRNQKFRTTMEEQMGWFQGDAMSRLDESGRLVVLGTRIKANDNYGRLIETFVGDSPVVYQRGSYTKYQNGVATVIFPAIQMDENGEEKSYWEDRFPLKSKLVLADGRSFDVEDLTEEMYAKLSAQPGAKRVRGLQEIRQRMGSQFETVYQQKPPRATTGDFTDAVLAAADDPTRSYEVKVASETLILGVDPARKFGAAYAVGGVDVDRGTITVIDEFWGQNLGVAGIKNKLIIEPISKWLPLWLVYEMNKHAGVLEDSQIVDFLKVSGTSVHPHQTTSHNRSDSDAGVPLLSTLMRNGTLRFPVRTPEDVRRTKRIHDHFQAFEEDVDRHSSGRSTSRDPDDLAFAIWPMVMKGLELIQAGKKRRVIPKLRGPVPASVMRHRRQFAASGAKLGDRNEPSFQSEGRPDPNDLVAVFHHKGGGR